MFTLFSDLPIEIRCQIWKEALPSTERVDARCIPYTSSPLVSRKRIMVSNPAPHFLICHEARREALRKYTLKLSLTSGKSTVWVEPEAMLILEIRAYEFDDTLFSIKHLGIDWEFFYRRGWYQRLREKDFRDDMYRFQNLESFSFMLRGKRRLLRRLWLHDEHAARQYLVRYFQIWGQRENPSWRLPMINFHEKIFYTGV